MEFFIKRRDASVEFIRIIACIIVIGVHTCLSSLVNGAPDAGRLFLACLFADGVAIFWMVSGFFMFDNKDYKKLLVRTLKSIVIPLFLFSMFMFYFSGWLVDGESLKESVTHSLSDYEYVIKTLLTFRNPIGNMGHLWYLYVYILLVISFPVLRAFANYLDEDLSHQKIFLSISFILLLINDITSNQTFSFSHYTTNAIVPAAIEMLWGHIIYHNRKMFSGKKFIGIGVILYIGCNLLRTLIQYNRYLDNASNKAILYWYSTIGVLCSIGIIMFGFNVIESYKNSRINSFICELSSYTFMVYLIHYVVRNVLNRLGFQSWLNHMILQGRTKFIYEATYDICILLTVFLLSLIVAIVLRKIKNGGHKLISLCRRKL